MKGEASASGAREREAELAARWAGGAWRGRELRALTGERYTLVYQGRPGGGAGPDFRDAILARADGERLAGDVELHLRASGWRAHGHTRDPRYDGVVLHAVLAPPRASDGGVTPLANGRYAPIVVLRPHAEAERATPAPWPCEDLRARETGAGLRALLVAAGLARFAERAALLERDILRELIDDAPHALWRPEERVLFVALAEGLGYGRDREALRLAGRRLADGAPPEALCDEREALPRVETQRLAALLTLRERWLAGGPWGPLRAALAAETPRAAHRALRDALRVGGGALSPGRADILLANVALPFAVAWGRLGDAPPLAERADAVYRALPGLPSNQITRLMTRQLGLPRLPAGAAAQQGLHHVWSETCRAKACARCVCAGAVSARS